MSGVFWKIQEILYSMGTEILKIGPDRAEKNRFKDFNLDSKIITYTPILSPECPFEY